MTHTLDQDVLSCIFSHIYDPASLYTILHAIPVNHLAFGIALKRLCELPIQLSGDEDSADDTLAILEYLLRYPDGAQLIPGIDLVEAIRHLVISMVEGDDSTSRTDIEERLATLFQKTSNLRVLDWHGDPGPSLTVLKVLQHLSRLKTLRVDCSVPVDGYEVDPWKESSWDINHFMRTLGPSLTSLDLQMINLTMYKSLESHSQSFKTFNSLQRLAVDLTDGVWDWDGGGSPQMGPSDLFVFRNLGFPALREVEMQVADFTITAEKPGPLDLVTWKRLESFRLIVQPCFIWIALRSIRLFSALPAEKFSSLKCLEIRDVIRNGYYWKWPDETPVQQNMWNESRRCFWGLVPQFLASVRQGSLQNLTSLWVDQSALCMPTGDSLPSVDWGGQDVTLYTVTELWTPGEDEEENRRKTEWIGILRDVLGRLTSLRVGFGPMDAEEVGLVLGCCDADQLTQFGFQYKWQLSERDSTVSSTLLDYVSRLSKLKDIHILHPRPGSQHVYRSSHRENNSQTIDDVIAVFNSNSNLCRVGVGQDAVWERGSQGTGDPRTTADTEDAILAQDGIRGDPRYLLDTAVPRFFDAGVLEAYTDDEFDDENPRRSAPGPQIKELRSMLERLLPSNPS